MYHFFTNTCNNLPDYSEEITHLKMPKQLIWGKHDDFLKIEKMKDKVISGLDLSEENIHLMRFDFWTSWADVETIDQDSASVISIALY